MRIGLIAPPWLDVPPRGYGGTESVIDRLARGYAAAGAEVMLFTTGESTCPVPRQWIYERGQIDQLGVAVVELRHVIHAYAAVRDCDVVHDHTVLGPLYAGRDRDQLVVTTNHRAFDDELADIYREIAGQVPIIAISHSQAASARDVPIAKVIHHGVDAEQFPVGKGGGGYFLFLGRMTPDKGARQAVLAALQAGVPLLMAAKMREPLEHEYFDSEVRPLLGDRIEYLGEVGHDEKLQLLGEAIALLNPITWAEPFGLVMVESLACGTPVLAFRRGAAPEIVDHGSTGFLCRDVDDMVARIAEVPQLDRAACRAAVEGRFSAGRMVDDHLLLFQELLR